MMKRTRSSSAPSERPPKKATHFSASVDAGQILCPPDREIEKRQPDAEGDAEGANLEHVACDDGIPTTVIGCYPGDAYSHIFTDEAQEELERAALLPLPDDDGEDDDEEERVGSDAVLGQHSTPSRGEPDTGEIDDEIPTTVVGCYPSDAYSHVFTAEIEDEVERAAETLLPDSDEEGDENEDGDGGDDGRGEEGLAVEESVADTKSGKTRGAEKGGGDASKESEGGAVKD